MIQAVFEPATPIMPTAEDKLFSLAANRTVLCGRINDQNSEFSHKRLVGQSIITSRPLQGIPQNSNRY